MIKRYKDSCKNLVEIGSSGKEAHLLQATWVVSGKDKYAQLKGFCFHCYKLMVKTFDKDSLLTLMVEAEGILNSRPLTVETISDPTSKLPLSLANILTIKSKVVMPPPAEFSKPDLYCQKRWIRIQHVINEFWSRWRKEFLQLLQERKKWQDKKRNFQSGDIVLLSDGDLMRNK